MQCNAVQCSRVQCKCSESWPLFCRENQDFHCSTSNSKGCSLLDTVWKKEEESSSIIQQKNPNGLQSSAEPAGGILPFLLGTTFRPGPSDGRSSSINTVASHSLFHWFSWVTVFLPLGLRRRQAQTVLNDAFSAAPWTQITKGVTHLMNVWITTLFVGKPQLRHRIKNN